MKTTSYKKICLLSGALVIGCLMAVPSFADVTYTYDARHRLIKAMYGDGRSVEYAYDSTGNRLRTVSTAP